MLAACSIAINEAHMSLQVKPYCISFKACAGRL